MKVNQKCRNYLSDAAIQCEENVYLYKSKVPNVDLGDVLAKPFIREVGNSFLINGKFLTLSKPNFMKFHEVKIRLMKFHGIS
jgi:hypothetical protein